MDPTFAAIAEEIARCAGTEAKRVDAMRQIGRDWGMSSDALDVAIDQARERYDRLVQGHQILLALAPVEPKAREWIDSLAGPLNGGGQLTRAGVRG